MASWQVDILNVYSFGFSYAFMEHVFRTTTVVRYYEVRYDLTKAYTGALWLLVDEFEICGESRYVR